MTFGDYVVSVRLEHAEADLRKTGDSVTRIAYRNGFRSTNDDAGKIPKKHGRRTENNRDDNSERLVGLYPDTAAIR